MAYTAIDDPSAYFKVQLWTGDDTSPRAIAFDDTDTDMQPDIVWIKKRNDAASHTLFDAVLGAGSTKGLATDNMSREGLLDGSIGTTAAYGYLSAFGSDGFTVTTGTSSDGYINNGSDTYVAWCWKESATAGCDILTYTGNATDDTDISHSLSAVPHLIIGKVRDVNGEQWKVYHHKNTSAPETDHLRLHTNDATTDDATVWSDEAPPSSVFTLGNTNGINESGKLFVSYLWSEKQGFSKFGSYVGNNAGADGIFCYTGFRPALVIQKAASAGNGEWQMTDNERDPFNPSDSKLNADRNNAEFSDFAIDILSNGFKTKADGADQQDSGVTYIYMAWAEAPFVNSNGVPCNAR